jgi:hypothetical protein
MSLIAGLQGGLSARVILLAVLPCGVSLAADCRLYFADQSWWEGKLGFVFNLEAVSDGETPCASPSVELVLGWGDGWDWRWLVHNRNWIPARTYQVKAVIQPGRAELYLDGQLISSGQGAFAPASGRLRYNSSSGATGRIARRPRAPSDTHQTQPLPLCSCSGWSVTGACSCM